MSDRWVIGARAKEKDFKVGRGPVNGGEHLHVACPFWCDHPQLPTPSTCDRLSDCSAWNRDSLSSMAMQVESGHVVASCTIWRFVGQTPLFATNASLFACPTLRIGESCQ